MLHITRIKKRARARVQALYHNTMVVLVYIFAQNIVLRKNCAQILVKLRARVYSYGRKFFMASEAKSVSDCLRNLRTLALSIRACQTRVCKNS